MGFLPDAEVVEIAQFNGVWVPSAKYGCDETKIPLNNGRDGLNMQYFGDSAKTRFGHSAVFTPGVAISSMVNWQFTYGTPAAPRNFLAWFAPGVGVQYADLDLVTPVTTLAIAQTTASDACIVPNGSRLYVAFIDANGLGKAEGQVFGFGIGADPLFAAPIITVPTFSELAIPNSTTLGAKLFGYLIQTRNGYITRPSPSPANVFTGISYTSLGGLIELTIPVPAGGWPAYALNVAAIMTTTANHAQFFIVPGPGIGIAPWFVVQTAAPTICFIAITDQALAETAQDASPYLNQLGQTVGGSPVPPILPSMIYPYGARMGYICLDASNNPVSYISDVSLPQSINAATSAVYLPANQRQTLAYSLRNTLYISGPHWTYSTSDSGGSPTNWPAVQLVDGTIGALGIHLVALNASQNNCWVADDSGLYLFQGGAYPDKPVSYYQRADWIRINFAVQNTIQIADDTTGQRVHVLVPLDGATKPTHILTWDYSLGPTPEQVKYSLVSLSGYLPGAIAMVQSSGSKHQDKWLAPQTAGPAIGLENGGGEASPYLDFGAGITSYYETSLVPRGTAGQMIQALAAQLRLSGSGNALLTIYGLDHAAQPDQPGPAVGNSLGPFSLPQFGSLQDWAGGEIFQQFWLQNEACTIRIQTDGVAGSWFNLSRINFYFTRGMGWR